MGAFWALSMKIIDFIQIGWSLRFSRIKPWREKHNDYTCEFFQSLLKLCEGCQKKISSKILLSWDNFPNIVWRTTFGIISNSSLIDHTGSSTKTWKIKCDIFISRVSTSTIWKCHSKFKRCSLRKVKAKAPWKWGGDDEDNDCVTCSYCYKVNSFFFHGELGFGEIMMALGLERIWDIHFLKLDMINSGLCKFLKFD